MISDLAVAERNLTPKKLFVNNQMKEKRATDFVSYDRKESASMKVAAGKEWDALNPEQQAVWELRSRSMIAQQPFIAGQIVDVLRCATHRSRGTPWPRRLMIGPVRQPFATGSRRTLGSGGSACTRSACSPFSPVRKRKGT